MSNHGDQLIHSDWGVFRPDEDGGLETIVGGYTRDEWLEIRMGKLVSYVTDIRAGRLNSQQAEAMRDSLVATLVNNGGIDGGEEGATKWLNTLIASDMGDDEIRHLVGGSDIIDGHECWRLFDDPVGELEQYAQQLTDKHEENVLAQPTLF